MGLSVKQAHPLGRISEVTAYAACDALFGVKKDTFAIVTARTDKPPSGPTEMARGLSKSDCVAQSVELASQASSSSKLNDIHFPVLLPAIRPLPDENRCAVKYLCAKNV